MRLSTVLLAVLLLLTGCSLTAPNTAEQELDTILSRLSSIHANKLCDNGDNGHGLDNTTPWYNDYFEVTLSPDIESRIESAAATAGFSLIRKPTPPPPDDPYGAPGDGSTPDATDTFLRGTHNDMTLEAVLSPNDPYLANCTLSGTYRPSLTPSRGKAILYLGVLMPDLRP